MSAFFVIVVGRYIRRIVRGLVVGALATVLATQAAAQSKPLTLTVSQDASGHAVARFSGDLVRCAYIGSMTWFPNVTTDFVVTRSESVIDIQGIAWRITILGCPVESFPPIFANVSVDLGVLPAGQYQINWTWTGTAGPYIPDTHAALSVAAPPALANQSLTFSSVPPPLNVTGTGSVSATSSTPNSGNPIVFSSLTPNVCSVAGATVMALSVGTCVVAANQAGNASFNAATQATIGVAIVPVVAVDTGTSVAVPATHWEMLALLMSLLAALGMAGLSSRVVRR